MDTDLQNLADLLEKRGLTVAPCDPEQRLHVTNPVSSLMSEEITLTASSYRTGFDYEVGVRGQEASAAHRIAYLLGATATKEAEVT